MPYSTILVKKEEGIASLIMNRPQQRNAQSPQMCEEVIAALEELSRDDGVKVVILTGAGAAFSVGGDLGTSEQDREKVLDETDAELVRRQLVEYEKVTRFLATMEKPTIAMVNGVAAGGGLDWALACDIRIGSDKARFRTYTQIGLTPEEGGWFLSRLLGYAQAVELVFSGDVWDAQRAKAAGLLNRVVPLEELERETMELARRIAKNSGTTLRLSKLLLRKAQECDLDTTLHLGAGFASICIASSDVKEGVRAFREKRQPQFKG